MCIVLEISKKTYYKYRDKQDKDYFDYIVIKQEFELSKKTYGYRRICASLLYKYDVVFNHKKVARIMAKYGLKPEYTKRKKNSSYKRIEANVKPNLIKRNFDTDKPNRVWVTDITYLIYKNKRVYLSTILDLYDRKIVSYKISKFNNIPLVIDTLNEAIANKQNLKGLIIHSDQGFQYTSYEYRNICEANNIQISMSRKGTPLDDAPIESFHGILKKETLYNNKYKDLAEYEQGVREWLKFYNTTRIKNKH